ncbi:MAG: iron dependent repressor, metal binding and dimerization domain protein [Lutibacter sp.]|nr:iron dependent repressor, metal binding and dimerization domain protein [Lutibacter sp.]
MSQLGAKTVIAINRKHRLWEVYLVEKFNFS